MGQEYGSGLAGWFWPGVSHEVALDVGQGCGDLKAWLALEDLLPMVALTWLGRFVLAVGKRLPPHVEISVGLLECSQDMAAGCLQSEWSVREQTRGRNVSFSWLLIVTHHHFCMVIKLPRSALFNVRKNHTRMWKPGGEDPQGWYGVWAVLQSFLTQTVKIATWSLLTLSSFLSFL